MIPAPKKKNVTYYDKKPACNTLTSSCTITLMYYRQLPFFSKFHHIASLMKKINKNKKRNEIWMKGAQYETKPHKDPNFNKKKKKRKRKLKSIILKEIKYLWKQAG